MKKIVIAAAMSLCMVSLAAIASADTLILRDGTRVPGSVVSVAARTITFEDTNRASRVATTWTRSMRSNSRRRVNATAAVGTSGSNRRFEMLPSGTELTVRTSEDIDSSTAVVDQTFSAIVERDILGRVGQRHHPRRFPRGTRRARDLFRWNDGQPRHGARHAIDDGQRATVSREHGDLKKDTGTGIGKNKRTAETVGGGAALGTIIGAIAGGAKGAAIGVLVGAAGGAGVQVLNKGKDVRVPAETLLTFRLDKPVSLQADR